MSCYTVAQAARRTGLSVHTLRYYDREGLLPFVDRSPAGYREFKENDFEWLAVIACLKSTGMHVKDIKQFIDWCAEGDCTLEKRLTLFKKQRENVERQIAELQKHREKLNHKIRYYELACRAGTEQAVKGLDCESL